MESDGGEGGTLYDDISGVLSLDTWYYFRIKRDEAVGTYGTIYCDIYTSEVDRANEENAFANLSITLHSAKRDYQYIYGLCNWAHATNSNSLDCDVEDLYLQEAVGEVLIDTGLVVRYFIDEAASGTGPTEVVDKSGVGSPFNLTLNYDGVMDYTEVGGNRGLECTDRESDAYARKIIHDDSDKIRDNLHGAQKITMEVVADVDSFSGNVGRLFALNSGVNAPSLGLAGNTAEFRFYWKESLVRSWLGSLSRTVFHIVIDTTQATPNDRIKIYEDGEEITPDYDGNPGENESLVIGSGSYVYMLNRGVTTWARSVDGVLFYAALYADIAFSQAQVSNNYDVLTIDDDHPIAGLFATLADTIGITDTIATARNIFKTVANTVGITDALSWIGAFFRSIVDTVGITDVITTIRNMKKSITDTVGITDTLVAAKFVLANLADTVGITDVLSRIGTFKRTIADTIGIKEPQGPEAGGLFVIDGEDAGDDPWEFSTILVGAGNTFELSAAAKNNGDYGYFLDVAGANGRARATKNFVASGPDTYKRIYLKILPGYTFGVDESYVIFKLYAGGTFLIRGMIYAQGGTTLNKWIFWDKYGGTLIFDTNFSVGDWHYIDLHWRQAAALGGTEYWVDGDLIRSGLNYNSSAYEPSWLEIGQVDLNPSPAVEIYFDDIKAAATGPIGAYSPVQLSPKASRGIVKLITDTVGITDVLTNIKGIVKSIADTVGLTDVLNVFKPEGAKFAALADTVGITDALTNIRAIVKSIADTVSVTDVVATARTIIKTITDTIGVTDVVSIVAVYIRALSDAASISDFLTANRGFVRSILDTVGITDSLITEIKERIIDSFGRPRIAKILGINKSKIEGVLGISKSDIVKSDDPDKPDIVGK